MTPSSSRPDDMQLFRFAIVSQVLARVARGESQADAVAAVASMRHPDDRGRLRRVSRRSVYRWVGAYEKDGIDGLADRPRRRAADRIEARLVDFLAGELRRDPEASIPELLRRAVLRRVVPADAVPHRATVHRALVRHGVPLDRKRKSRGRDSRRFAYPHRMDMVLCDGKHFRAGATRLRRVAMSYLDDATREVLHVVVGPSESAELFLRGLYECVLKHGLMTALYLDHGSGFIADATRVVTAKLGVHLVLGEVAYPQGHGKIERYHRTLEAGLLRFLDRRPDVDPSMPALELRLRHYVHDVYAHSPHEGLSGDTPHRRFFEKDARPLRLVTDPGALEQAFEVEHARLVSPDHVVSLDGVPYEMPRGTAGRTVTLFQRVLGDQVFVEHDGRRVRLHPVDAEANARSPRARRADAAKADEAASSPPSGSAAELSFRERFPPLVGDDGGSLPDLLDLDDPFEPPGHPPNDLDDIPF